MNRFAILPAAGRSRRMGQPKLLMPWGTYRTMLEATLATWEATGIDEILVVAHPDDRPLHRIVANTRARLVIPEVVPQEMKFSIRAGLRWLKSHRDPGPNDVWLLAPADMPQFSPTIVPDLIARYLQNRGRTIIVPRHDGRRGHPVLFPWLLVDEVERLDETEGVNVLLQRHPVEEVELADSRILEDVDTPEDYQRLRPPMPS